ncbi:hypothetical protein LSM04_001559 [Trypanosoma melophagium]|uniref:uncharacterized protein n=1 Tax=Trypanosoma melophagium TaxID=715481 RepID=UPI00351A7FDC|nr:hypothetical protein LSM04_001559 [Trypanosoma melophagium]
MQKKITRVVRIVFRLFVSTITECLPGKGYIVQIKRGDKINASSPLLTADEKGVVDVGLKRIFTSTLQRRSDWKYKVKELKFSITEFHTQKVIRFSYDLSKGMDRESFPERRVTMKGRDGSPQLYFELQGTEETRYNQEHGIESSSDASFTSYMREPSSESVSGQTGIIEGRDTYSVNSSAALNEFESVIQSVTEASSEIRSDDAQFEEIRRNEKECGTHTSEEIISPSRSECYHERKNSSMISETQSTISSNKDKNRLETQEKEGLRPEILKGKEIKPPPKVPSRRIVVSSSDFALEAVKRIHNAVKLGATSAGNSQSLKEPLMGAQLALHYYLKWNGELLKRFILHFIAYLTIDVCKETRHLGDWLSLLTHAMYQTILGTKNELNSSSIQEVAVQIAAISSLDDKTFISRGNQVIDGLAGNLNLAAASELFWIAGLEYCAVTIASLSIPHLQHMCDEFPMILPFSQETSFSFEEHIIIGTTLLFSELSSIISALNPTARVTDPHLIYNTLTPLYRIVLVSLVKEYFATILGTIIKGIYRHPWNDDCSGSYLALRVLKLSKSWAEKNHLLSALSICLMALIAYCDLLLFPDEILQGDDYKSLMIKFPPSVDVKNKNGSECCYSQPTFAMILGCLETKNKFSLFDTLIEFTPSKCDMKAKVENGMWGLLEILNGDEREAKQIIAIEEFFPGTGFNGMKNTLYNPELVLPFLRNEVGGWDPLVKDSFPTETQGS